MSKKTQKGFIEYAINQIKERFNIELPNFGAIAGQSVAELYFEYYGYDIKTRIKDIDLFLVPMEGQTSFLKKHIKDLNSIYENKWRIYKTKLHYKKKTVDNYRSNSFIEETIENSIKQKFKVKKIEKTETCLQIIKSTDSFSNDLLNITFYKNAREGKINFVKNLISLFDINAVKIGIDLKTKKLYLDDDFKKFLKTRYVSIDHKNFKPCTIIRYFDKYGYYKNCIFNIEQELIKNYLSEFYNSDINKKYHSKMFVASRFDKLNKKSLDAIKKYLSIEDKSIFIKQEEIHFYKTKDLTKKLKSLIPKYKNDEDITNHIKIKIDLNSFAELTYSEFLIFKPFLLNSDPEDSHINNFINYINSEEIFDKFTNILKSIKDQRYVFIQNSWNIPKYKEENLLFYKINDEEHELIIEFLSAIITFNFKSSFYTNKCDDRAEKIFLYSSLNTCLYRIKNKQYLRDFKNKILDFEKLKKIEEMADSESFIYGSKKDKDIFVYPLLSKNNIKKINSYNLKHRTQKNDLLEVLSKSIYLYNDKSIINIKKNDLTAILRHGFILNIINYYPILKEEIEFKNIKDLYEKFAEKIRYFENSEYIYFIGLFENNTIPLSLFFKDIKFLLEYLKTLSFFNESHYIIDEFKNVEKEGIIIRQLKNRLELIIEGKEMRHCIGGNSFKKCQLHFSIINKNNKERTTFSVFLDRYHNDFKLREIKNKFNKKTSLENKKIAESVIKTINNKYKKELLKKLEQFEPLPKNKKERSLL